MVRLRDNLAIALNGSMNPLEIKEFFQKAQPCTAFQVRLAAAHAPHVFSQLFAKLQHWWMRNWDYSG